MRVGDKVVHVEYPTRPGRIVAKTKKWPSQLQTFLVKWDTGEALSRHIEAALQKVGA